MTCSTKNVVYRIQCPCGMQYVGRTMRMLQVRLNEHIVNIKHGLWDNYLYKHYARCHNKDPIGTLGCQLLYYP